MSNKIGKLILRLGLGIVFLYFGINQLLNYSRWVSFLPNFLSNSSMAAFIIYLNAIFDIFIGVCLIFGLFLKIVSILGFLHLLGITLFSLGLNSPSGIRDLGLAFSILALFFLKD